MKIIHGVTGKDISAHQSRLSLMLRCFFFILIFACCLYADDRGVLKNSDLLVRFDQPLSGAAKKVMDIYPAVRTELEAAAGWKTRLYPVVVLVRDTQNFRQVSGNDLTVAFAVPSKDLIVIDFSKMGTGPFTLETTLKHELCHLLLHDRLRGKDLPRWLDEGYCQWVNNGLAEIITDGKWSPVQDAALTGRFLSLAQLSERFPEDKKGLLLAYDESRSIVDYIVAEYGAPRLEAVLEDLGKGGSIGTAVEKGLSTSLYSLEQKWLESLKKKSTWLTYVSNYLYELLFMIAALVTFAGFIRMLLRKRAYKDEDEENDEGDGEIK